MKETVYKCDRCGKKLCEDGNAIESKKFVTETQTRFRIHLWGNWKAEKPEIITYELCKKCREQLDDWLEVYDH